MPAQTKVLLTHQDGQSTNMRLVLNTLNQFLADKNVITGVCQHTKNAYFDPNYKMRFKSDHVLGRLRIFAPFHAGLITFPECAAIQDKTYSERGLNIYVGEYKFDGDERTPKVLLNSECFMSFALHSDEHSVSFFKQLSQYFADKLESYAVFFAEDDTNEHLTRVY